MASVALALKPHTPTHRESCPDSFLALDILFPHPSFYTSKFPAIRNLDTYRVGNGLHANLFMPDIQGLSIPLRIYQVR